MIGFEDTGDKIYYLEVENKELREKLSKAREALKYCMLYDSNIGGPLAVKVDTLICIRKKAREVLRELDGR